MLSLACTCDDHASRLTPLSHLPGQRPPSGHLPVPALFTHIHTQVGQKGRSSFTSQIHFPRFACVVIFLARSWL